MRIFVLFIILLTFSNLSSQNEIGLFSIRNFGMEDFNSQVQNFDVTQDESGIIYVGNKEGVLEYRGGIWRKHQLSNFNDATCVEVAENGLIFTGGIEDFGYFSLDTANTKLAVLKYYSIGRTLDSNLNFGKISFIDFQDGFTYFLSDNYLFIYKDGKTETLNFKETLRGFVRYKDKLYLKIDQYGLKEIQGSKLINVRNVSSILIKKPVQSVSSAGQIDTILVPALGHSIPFDDEWNLAYSQQNGFFLYKIVNGRLETKSYTPLNNFKHFSVSAIVRVGKRTIALGTLNSGIYIVSYRGTLLYHFDTKNGLANNRINALHFDKQHHLWAALNQGISRIKLDDQWQVFHPEKSGYTGIIESIARFNGKLYIATGSAGLFVLDENSSAGEMRTFTKVTDSTVNMGCYYLKIFQTGGKSMMLIITDNGMTILDETGKFTASINGFIYTVHADSKDPNRLWLGLDEGLATVYYNGVDFEPEGKVPEANIPAMFIEFDADGNVWSSNILSKVICIENPEFVDGKISEVSIKTYSSSDGLPADNAIYPQLIDGRMYFGTGEGIYTLDDDKKRFVSTDYMGSLFNNSAESKGRQCHRIFVDRQKQLWIVSKSLDESRLQIYKLFKQPANHAYQIDKVFEIKGKGDIFNAIYQDVQDVMWFGGVSSLYRFESEKSIDSIPFFFTYVLRVVAGVDTIFDGYQWRQGQMLPYQNQLGEMIIPYRNNKLVFSFSSLLRNHEEAVLYSYQLEGFEKEWSAWDTRGEERFTNLPEGSYTFKVRAMDRLGNISDEATFQFEIKPPWYRTIWAYVGYLLFFVAFVWGAITISTRGLKKIIREATAEIQAQKDELEEKNQNILDSIRYAKRIQEAVTPSDNQMQKYFPDHFVLWRPRDIVSGDFFWMMHKNNKTVLAAADCTGHGVPGAFMSIMGISFLNQIANLPEVQTAADALNHLRTNVITSLNKEGSETDTKDGMDISLCVYDFENMIMDFSGAYNPLYMIRDGEITVVKADRMPVGVHDRMDTPFTTNKFTMKKGDVYYILSDGYIDQFGGPQGKKFMTKQFKDLIMEIYQKPMEEQSQILEKTLIEWRGEIEQVDDIIIIGVRIP
ncbi:MAG: SpoIIE family protein phosphatase [Bacteroidales bacterium]|nr:SpoIIE family protein phosphatase [Bacteroidales bacterium]